VAIALVALVVQLPGLVSTSQVRSSRESFQARDFDRALGQATDAVQAEPWAAGPYAQRALVEEGIGRLSDASADLRRAIEREPDNWRHRLVLARVEAERGHADSAIRAYRAARRLRSGSSLFTGEASDDDR
jgi:cytochrome c-type biogenesis protein CcmH/NrfG